MIQSINTSAVIKILVMLGALLPVGVRAQLYAKEQFAIPLSKPDQPFKLKVELAKGSIEVVGHDGKEIIVHAVPEQQKIERTEPNANINSNSNGNININNHEGPAKANKSFGGKYLRAVENNNNITITSSGAGKTVITRIMIPRNQAELSLVIKTEGQVIVSDVAAKLEITNTNGIIQLTGIAGSVIANTVTGNITASLTSVTPGAPMAFSTLIGNVDISFPASINANLKMKSDNGNIYSDFPIAQNKNIPNVQAEPVSGDGKPKYKIGNAKKTWIYSRINQGGPEIMFSNMNGDILVRMGK